MPGLGCLLPPAIPQSGQPASGRRGYDRAIAVLRERVGLRKFPERQSGCLPFEEAADAARLEDDPKAAIARGEQAADNGSRQRVKAGEVNAIETKQPFPSSQPQISILCLGDAKYFAKRKVAASESGMNQVADFRLRIKR